MMHKNRVWCVTPKTTPEEVAELLTQTTWTLCTAFDSPATCSSTTRRAKTVPKSTPS